MASGQPILQFGTSRFLQAHVDLFVSEAAERGEALGGITVVQTTSSASSSARTAALARPEGFEVRIRGLADGRTVDERRTCNSVREALDARNQWPTVRERFRGPVRVVVSNTGDTGWQLHPQDSADLLRDDAPPPSTFPAKLLVLLHDRWRAQPEAELTLLPCELVSRNGEQLRQIVLGLAEAWSCPAGFPAWLQSQPVWANSLVDRIVSEALEPVGAVAEPYALWAVERQPRLQLPCSHPAIVLTDDLARFERLKLLLLNLGHTLLAEGWLQGGYPADMTVLQAMNDAPLRQSLEAAWQEEVLPVFAALGQHQEASAYLVALRERLLNPFLRHRLADIAQNHAQKKARRIAPVVALAGQHAPALAQPRLRAVLAAPDPVELSASECLLVLHASDNVGVARVALPEGATLLFPDGGRLQLPGPVEAGHKLALQPIPRGEVVRKYGQAIGMASMPIESGAHVHVHNVEVGESHPAHGVGRAYLATEPAHPAASFEGYVRADGRVGTRNYIGVVSSVNCSATVCKAIAQAFAGQALAAYPGVDGVVAITHGSGCGMSAQGEGIDLLRRTLRGYATHPNFASVLVIGLGCEVNQVDALTQGLGADPARLRTLTVQQAGGTRQAIEQGVAAVHELAALASSAKRSTVPAAQLVVGLQCGGSDGYSGISANPALGAAVDLLVRHGGTAILSETPEIYGAEHLLTARAATPEVAERLMARLRWWEDYTRQHGAEMNNNPSPGNKAGGITTILEKSLGAVAKGGGSGLMDVVEYAQQVHGPGLVFMDTPGYDPVSATGQVAGGANLICFTTGRGSTYGCKPTPSLKLATNTAMYRRMQMDMDFNAGAIVDGTLSVDEAGKQLFLLMLATASGRRTLSEEHGLGDNEFVPWQLGAVM